MTDSIPTPYKKYERLPCTVNKHLQGSLTRGRSLTEVAMLSGFQSIPSFNRVFKEEKGMAPRDYRALFLRNDKKDDAAPAHLG